MEKLNAGENIYCCFGSLKKLHKFKDNLIQKKILKENEILYYHSMSDGNKTKLTLTNINEEWSKYRLVCTTPTITVGCSFDTIHFHSTFIIAYPSCFIRDLMQTHMRVRNLINNIIYYKLPFTHHYNFIKSQAHISLNLYH